MSNFRHKTITGIGWTTIAQMSKLTIQFVLVVILSRLLNPQDFGTVGMITVFTGFAAIFSELGFNAALVQKENIEERHYSSIFWINLLSGLGLTGLIIVMAPFIARFYHNPKLLALTMFVALNFVITPLSMVQNAILRRAMEFRLIVAVEIITEMVAGASAVGLALMGYGVWSLVAQMLIASSVIVLGLWWSTDWQPRLFFDRTAVMELFGFSANLLGFNVINYWLRNGDNLLIGKFMGSRELGIYSRAYNLMLLPLTQISGVLSRVMFPALSRIQHNQAQVKHIYLRSIATIALFTFPMMMGLFVVADRFVLALYGPKWVDVIPLLKVFCLVGMGQSLETTVGWLYQALGRTDWMFWWGIGAGILLMSSIVLGIWFGTIYAVALCYALMNFGLFYPAFAIPGRLIGMTFGEIVATVIGILSCSAIMASFIWSIELLMPTDWSHWAYLAIQVPAGMTVYGLLLHIFKVAAYKNLLALVKEQWQLRKKQP